MRETEVHGTDPLADAPVLEQINWEGLREPEFIQRNRRDPGKRDFFYICSDGLYSYRQIRDSKGNLIKYRNCPLDSIIKDLWEYDAPLSITNSQSGITVTYEICRELAEVFSNDEEDFIDSDPCRMNLKDSGGKKGFRKSFMP